MLAAITDYTFEDVEFERSALGKAGCRLEARRSSSPQELRALVEDADVVITQFARLDAGLIAGMRRARAIVRYGIGVDNVDGAAARERGIPLCNIPDYCIDEVADHALAMILDLQRRIRETAACTARGEWRLPVPVTAMRTLAGQRVGVVGFGRIGRAVVRRLLAFGTTVLVHDPVVAAEAVVAAGALPCPLDQLLAESDCITLHCPSTDKTRRLISAPTLARMRAGSCLVNVGRGDLVDSLAVTEALASGHLRAAAFDVWDPEPIPADHPIRAMPQVAITPHVASVSTAATRRLREGVIANALKALRGEPLPSVVNGVAHGQAARAGRA